MRRPWLRRAAAILGISAGAWIFSMVAMSWMANQPDNLGVTNGRLAACPSTPNCVSTQAEDDSHRIEPIRFAGSRAEAMQRVRAAVADLPRSKIVRETDDYLHAEVRSLLFRFVDDVEFYVDEADGLIHFRSASRVGHSDLGVNRRRMEQLRTAIGG